MIDKETRINEVEELISAFCDKHLNAEYKNFSIKLWKKLSRKKTYSITGGKKEVWAAAVITVIARLNFLFDKTSDHYLTTGIICDYFESNKGTVASKAKNIEDAAKIRLAEEGFCLPEIHNQFTSVQLPNGMVVSKETALKMGFMMK